MKDFSGMPIEEQVARSRAGALEVARALNVQIREQGDDLHVVRNGNTLFVVEEIYKPVGGVWAAVWSDLLHIQSWNVQRDLEELRREANRTAPALEEPIVIPHEALA